MLRRPHNGFSLVELIIGMAILAMLMALGMPQYANFIANSRLRATAEGISNGLNTARAEAVKRNARAVLVFIDEEPVEALVNALTPVVNGPNWVVRGWVPATNSFEYIDGKIGAEGSGGSGVAGVQVTAVTSGIYDGTIAFTGFGALNGAQSITFEVKFPTAGTCDTTATPGPMRCLNVTVSPGGQIRICDPKVTDTKDTRAC
jgi:type IV fimbrial biogenesis protein FimT